jgi:acetylornithine deacetylase/succinyl-diaminopimelate desuccinylase-like protein
MQDWERIAANESPLTDAAIAEQAGVVELFGESGYSAVERIGARPTAEINGIGSGYQGEGGKTVLPAEATFKITFRLVANQKPETILALARQHFKKLCPPGIRLEITDGHGGEPFFLNPHGTQGTAACRALESVFGKKPALTREGGSIPILADFEKILGHAALLLALASPDCRAHSPNENFPVENFLTGIRLNKALLRELAG